MNRRLIGLVAALALAAIGTTVLVGYVRSAEARALEGERLVDVLVVTETVESGTKSEELADKVRTEQVPSKVRAAGAVSDLGDLKGRVAAVDLLAGEQIVSERFVAPDVQRRGAVPEGMLEVTVQLDPARAVGGRVVPGSTVGVVVSFDDLGTGGPVTHLMLHKVLVTAVQADQPPPSDDEDDASIAPKGSLLITLAVDAASAEKVVFAAEHGRLWLTLEPENANEAGTRVQQKGSVFA